MVAGLSKVVGDDRYHGIMAWPGVIGNLGYTALVSWMAHP
jgi:hypothetical protein